MKRVDYLDGWRGCAIGCVLFAHFGTNRGINLGRFGVELFFVLSGRLMAEILFVRATPLATFFARRLSRVYPALFVFATTMLLVSLIGSGNVRVIDWLAAITFTANYADQWIGRTQMLDHVWSLCIEEHLYILLGLVAFAHRRGAIEVLPACMILMAAAIANGAMLTIANGNYYDVYWRSDVRGASILIGVVVYLLLNRSVPTLLAARWTPLGLGLIGLALNTDVVPDPIKYSLGTLCLATSLVLMPRVPAPVLRLLEHPLLRRIGLWSYSIYLWQQPFAGMNNHGINRPLHLAMLMICALLSFYAIEQPARRLLNQRLHLRRSTVTAEPAPATA